jgi:hypothetical protein
MNKRRVCGLVLGMLVGLLAGCNGIIAGQWRSIEPAEVPPDVPRIRQITFQQDGLFEGRMTQQYRTTSVKGTYQFDGTELVLRPEGYDGGNRFVYHVAKIGNVLRLTQNQTTNRLCREAGGSVASPPALPDEPATATAPATQPEE